MDKKPIGYVKGQPNVMDKKIKANPKYNNIKKTLNTGITAKNIEVISNQLVAKRKGE
jgi:centrosomal protein CEP41